MNPMRASNFARRRARTVLPLAALRAAGAAIVCAFAAASGEAQQGLDFESYRERVEPIFMRRHGEGQGLNPGACVMCHSWQVGTPFQLQPLQHDAGGDPYWTEARSRKNFEVVSALVTPGAPQNSMLLRKPLAADAGGTEDHVGGKFWQSQNDPEWQVLAEWVRSASAGQPAARPRPPEVDYEFFRSCVQRIFLNPRGNAVPCAACHDGGSNGFAPEIPGGRDYWNDEESRRNFAVAMRFISPGYPLQSLFLQNALHPDAGGTPMHGGGKRWESQDDPEWQALAAWVRGENRGSTCPAPLQF
jgi:hypothetical protein